MIAKMIAGEKTFDGQEDDYHRFIKNSFSWDFIERPALDKHLKYLLEGNPKIMDAGCGSGRVIGHLISLGVSPHKITGLDENESFLEIAAKEFPRVKFVHSKLETAQIPGRDFDLITCSMVLQHFSERQLRFTMENFSRWLKPGGHLLYLVSHPGGISGRPLSSYFDRNLEMIDTPWHIPVPYYHKTVSDYINQVLRVGLAIEAVEEPEVSPGAREINPQEYDRYTQKPNRLVILSVK